MVKVIEVKEIGSEVDGDDHTNAKYKPSFQTTVELTEVVCQSIKKRGWQQYLRYRLKNSKIRKFVMNELTSSQADTSVTTLAVVNGLLFTIPFSIMGNLNLSYFDSVFDTLANCTASDPKGSYHTGANVYDDYHAAVLGVIATTFSSLILQALYFALRPDEDEVFKEWWRTCKYLVFVIYAMTIASVIELVLLYNSIKTYYMVPTQYLCAAASKGSTSMESHDTMSIVYLTCIVVLSGVCVIFMI